MSAHHYKFPKVPGAAKPLISPCLGLPQRRSRGAVPISHSAQGGARWVRDLQAAPGMPWRRITLSLFELQMAPLYLVYIRSYKYSFLLFRLLVFLVCIFNCCGSCGIFKFSGEICVAGTCWEDV